MEKFYDVTNSNYGKEYIKFMKTMKNITKQAKEFVKEIGIETNEIGYLGQDFYIKPTNSDVDKFDKILKKEKDGMRAFKLTSTPGKRWIEILKEIGVEELPKKPKVIFYFEETMGIASARTVVDGEKVYLNFKNEHDKLTTTNNDFKEITENEFYKILKRVEAKK